MDKEEIKRRLNKRIDEDDQLASDVGEAISTGNDSWLSDLIFQVIGIVVAIGSAIWNWLTGNF